jgi:cystathionine beta-lyase/cystathionine gamma-synthase
MRRRRPCAVGAGRVTTTLISVLSAGDRVLVTDNVYRPSRNFCNGMLARYGVEVSYFDPLIGAGIDSHPGHAIWKPDFTGASGLFSIVLKPVPQNAADALLDTVKLFGMGFSWGGFESLIIPFDCDPYRTATKWSPGGRRCGFTSAWRMSTTSRPISIAVLRR